MTQAVDTSTPTVFTNLNLTGSFQVGVSASNPLVTPTYQNSIYQSGLNTVVTQGTFTAGTTTPVSITNPFSATSTVVIANIRGQNGTTTIDLLMGTSTQASGLTNNSQVSPTLIKAVQVATSTQFFFTSGTFGAGMTSGTPTFTSIVVGPSESVVLMATSSFAGSSATGNQGVTNSNSTFTGTYVLEWQR